MLSFHGVSSPPTLARLWRVSLFSRNLEGFSRSGKSSEMGRCEILPDQAWNHCRIHPVGGDGNKTQYGGGGCQELCRAMEALFPSSLPPPGFQERLCGYQSPLSKAPAGLHPLPVLNCDTVQAHFFGSGSPIAQVKSLGQGPFAVNFIIKDFGLCFKNSRPNKEKIGTSLLSPFSFYTVNHVL